MKYQEFPDCCGIGVIYRLSNSYTIGGYSPADYTADDLSGHESTVGSQNTIGMITTVSQQETDDDLQAAGWIPILQFRNRNTSKLVKVWIKNCAANDTWRGKWDAEIKFLQEKT